jgi:Family of unknown function (DUF6069)
MNTSTTTSTTIEPTRPQALRVRGARALGVIGAAIAAAAVWAIAVPLFGVQLQVRFGSGALQGVGIDIVVISSLLGSLVGWGVLVLLEQRTARARAIWTSLAAAGLLASLSLPLIAGATISTKATLALMHLAVGAVLIPAMRRASSH